MGKFALVTGASSGIGRAISIRLSKSPEIAGVLAVARREELLKETQALGEAAKIQIVTADVTTKEGRSKIAKAVQDTCPKNLSILIQNAGVIGKIDKAMKQDEESWKNTFEVNVHAPLFLTQSLVSDIAPQGRILHIGSGAAYNALDGWSAYCCTKACFLMLNECLKKELAPQGVLVGSVKPGIVESPMQEVIRSVTSDEMELVEQFRDFKKNEYKSGQSDESEKPESAGGSDSATAADETPHAPPVGGLDTASNAAHFVRFLLTPEKVSDEEYVEKEWDIRDTFHHDRWVGKEW